MDLYLALLAGALHEQAIPLPAGRRLVLGRSAHQADVVLPSTSVSRRHCEVGRDEGGAWAQDLGSRNRTRLNGSPISASEKTPVGPGDLLGVADVQAAVVRVDPSWLAWNDGAVRKLARVVGEGRSFDRLPLLADALEEAGCTDANLLAHCRGKRRCYICFGTGRNPFRSPDEVCQRCVGGWAKAGEHAGGCCVADLLLDKS